MTELITNIGELTTNTAEHGRMSDAAVVVDRGHIVWIGTAADSPAADTMTDARGRAVLPGWVDTHTHLVFAGERSTEFEARMAGRKYAAGGIASTVAATRRATSDQLLTSASGLRREAELQGTTTLETKTGYGLDVASERKSAQVAAQVADTVTFLGAHLVPAHSDRRDYLDLVTGPMLEAVLPFVQSIDVFCEEGAFTPDESREVLEAGTRAGLALRVHGNQLGRSGGVKLAVELGARSVDHCNHLDIDDIERLAASSTVATFLPACDLSTREPFGPAREILDAGGRIALATNCNPGSSYTTSMAFCVATAVLQMQLTIDEAIFAATRGAALSLVDMSPSDEPSKRDANEALGLIRVGAPADLHLLNAPSVTHLAYRPGLPLTAGVWRRGRRTVGGDPR